MPDTDAFKSGGARAGAACVNGMAGFRRIVARFCGPAILHGDNETTLVREFLGARPGVFVDVGANEPVLRSQSYHLEQLGWRGVLIEPLAEYAERLRRERSAVVYAVAAGAPEDAGTERPLLVAGSLSTLGAALVEPNAAPSEIRSVPVRTLDQILASAGIEAVDFVSIDVEGTQLDVLRGFSLETFRPRLMLVEDHMRSLAAHRHLCARGYRLVRRTGLNNWYVPAGAAFPVSPFGRCQLARKLYLGLWLRQAKHARVMRRKARRQDSSPM